MKMEKGRKLISKSVLFLGILLSLALMLGLIPVISLTAYAKDTKAYAAYDVTTDANKNKSGNDLTKLQVKFNGKPWYIIADNSTSATAGTVTLLAADTSFGLSEFTIGLTDGQVYSSSTVKAILDALTASGGSFADVADTIVTNTDAGGKLYLLSYDEANQLSSDVLKMSFKSGNDFGHDLWWLRSPSINGSVSYADGVDGWVTDVCSGVNIEGGIRPALTLNLSKVFFSSGSNTFSLEPAEDEETSAKVTFKVVNGSWNDGTTKNKTVTLKGKKGDTLKLSADQIPAVGTKPASGYAKGSWDTTPGTSKAITKDVTYTYTYAKASTAAAKVTKAPTAKKLTYNGKDQMLVAKGTASNGKMYYAVTKNTTAPKASEYKTSIPTGKAAGTYYVWYKAKGNKGYKDSAVKKVKVTIAKRAEPLSFNTSFKCVQSNGKAVISWTPAKNIEKVEVFAGYCGTDYPKKPIATTVKNTVTIKTINGKKLNQRTAFKVYLIGYDKNGKKVGATVTAHFAGKDNKKFTNVKSLTLNKTSATIKKGNSTSIKVSSLKLESSKKKQISASHGPEVRYTSTNPYVAKVNGKGKITGVDEGTCYVYAYARSGYSKYVKVTVTK